VGTGRVYPTDRCSTNASQTCTTHTHTKKKSTEKKGLKARKEEAPDGRGFRQRGNSVILPHTNSISTAKEKSDLRQEIRQPKRKKRQKKVASAPTRKSQHGNTAIVGAYHNEEERQHKLRQRWKRKEPLTLLSRVSQHRSGRTAEQKHAKHSPPLFPHTHSHGHTHTHTRAHIQKEEKQRSRKQQQ
jgi:hypothetical protein